MQLPSPPTDPTDTPYDYHKQLLEALVGSSEASCRELLAALGWTILQESPERVRLTHATYPPMCGVQHPGNLRDNLLFSACTAQVIAHFPQVASQPRLLFDYSGSNYAKVLQVEGYTL